MGTKLKDTQYYDLFLSVHGKIYDYSETIFTNTRTPIIIICKKHGPFEQLIGNHKKGVGCKLCAIEKRKKKKSISVIKSKGGKKLTTDAVIERFINIHDTVYDYSKVEYIKNDLEVEIICSKHGSFFQKPYIHWGGSGCPDCKGGKKLTTDTVIERFNNIHGTIYDYSKVEYIKNDLEVEIICSKHGSFFQKPYIHWGGSGCPDCRDPNILNREEVFGRLNNIGLDDYSEVEYNGMHVPVKLVCPEHNGYYKSLANYFAGYRCPKCSPKSRVELELLDLIPGSIVNDRTLIKPLEIDILNHMYKFGIEYNGLMYHSFGTHKYKQFDNLDLLDTNKHLHKTEKMEELGYQLFHIKETDWLEPIKREIWISVINSKLNNTIRLFARKLKIFNLTGNYKFVSDFLKFNHLQGPRNFSVAYGLGNEAGEIYSVMTFGKPEKGEYQYEILRFCNLRNTTVIGGASKLLKYFERNIKPESLLTYAKRDWSQGNLYERLGFTFKDCTKPSIFWFDPKTGRLYDRRKFQKYKLSKELEKFDKYQTADQNMFNNGYRKYYDSGNKKYVKIYKDTQRYIKE